MIFFEYFKILEREAKVFEEAEKIKELIEKRAKEIFEDAEVYIVGSYKEKKHKLFSDLDILIVSEKIPEKINFEWYYNIVKKLLEGLNFEKINIHLVNKKKFGELQKLYKV